MDTPPASFEASNDGSVDGPTLRPRPRHESNTESPSSASQRCSAVYATLTAALFEQLHPRHVLLPPRSASSQKPPRVGISAPGEAKSGNHTHRAPVPATRQCRSSTIASLPHDRSLALQVCELGGDVENPIGAATAAGGGVRGRQRKGLQHQSESSINASRPTCNALSTADFTTVRCGS